MSCLPVRGVRQRKVGAIVVEVPLARYLAVQIICYCAKYSKILRKIGLLCGFPTKGYKITVYQGGRIDVYDGQSKMMKFNIDGIQRTVEDALCHLAHLIRNPSQVLQDCIPCCHPHESTL